MACLLVSTACPVAISTYLVLNNTYPVASNTPLPVAEAAVRGEAVAKLSI
jgi:hypothetical protein